MKDTSPICKNKILSYVMTTLLCAAGFLLIIYHIANGETNIVSAGFELLYIGIPILAIIVGSVMLIMGTRYDAAKWLKSSWYVIVYIIFRLTSCFVNGLLNDFSFWITFCFELLFLVAINEKTVGTTTIRIFFCMLIAFDLIAISICTYHQLFLKEMMTSATDAYPEAVRYWLPFSLLFSNPNPAGMLAGLCVSLCILTFDDLSKHAKTIVFPIIVINSAFMIWSSCRSAIIGTLFILVIYVFRHYRKVTNYKRVLILSLIICVIFLIPVYTTALIMGSDGDLNNTDTEIMLDEISTGRYNIWKVHILSQKGRYILGFGTSSYAVKARTDYIMRIEEADKTDKDDKEESHQQMASNTTLGVHNGYLELVLVAGLPAAIIIIAFIISRIMSMDNSFLDLHPQILLLVFLFWICVQESRFLVSGVKYMAFLMMLLLNWREDEEAV